MRILSGTQPERWRIVDQQSSPTDPPLRSRGQLLGRAATAGMVLPSLRRRVLARHRPTSRERTRPTLEPAGCRGLMDDPPSTLSSASMSSRSHARSREGSSGPSIWIASRTSSRQPGRRSRAPSTTSGRTTACFLRLDDRHRLAQPPHPRGHRFHGESMGLLLNGAPVDHTHLLDDPRDVIARPLPRWRHRYERCRRRRGDVRIGCRRQASRTPRTASSTIRRGRTS